MIATPANRYNLFEIGNKAWRYEMHVIGIRIQYTNLTGTTTALLDRIDDFLDGWVQSVTLKAQHIAYYLPISNQGIALLIERHQRIAFRLCDNLKDGIAMLRQEGNPERKKIVSQRFFYDFSDFVSISLHGMNREENDLMIHLWQCFSDLHLLEVEGLVLEQLSGDQLQLYIRSVVKAISPQELRSWFFSINTAISAPFAETIMQLIAPWLPEGGLHVSDPPSLTEN